MESLLSSTEKEEITDFLGLANGRQHVEFECKVLANTKAAWNRNRIEKTIARLKRRFTDVKKSEYMTITTGDNQRIQVNGQANVQKVCVQGNLEGVEHTVVEKRSFLDQLERDKGSKESVSIQSDSILLKDVDVKLTLRSELPFQKKYKEIPHKSFIRIIQRYTFSTPSSAFQWDISLIRSGYSTDGLSTIVGLHPRYEVEMEYIHGGKMDTPDVLKTHLVDFENALIPVFQVFQGTDFVLPESLRRKYLEQFKSHNPVFINVMTFTQKNLDPSDPDNVLEGYTITEKTDGERCMLFVTDDRKIVRITNTDVVSWSGLYVDHTKDVGSILDGEYLPKLNLFKIFDILTYRGKDVRKLPLYKSEDEDPDKYRLGLCNLFAEAKKSVELGYVAMTIETKTFIFAEGEKIWEACKKLLEAEYPYEIDGLIFTPAHLGYGESGMTGRRWNKLLKWKPPHQNTIDFLVQKPLEGMDGIYNGKPYKLANLYVGSSGDAIVFPALQLTGEYQPPKQKDSYIKIPFTPTKPSNPDAYVCRLYLDADGQPYTQNPKQKIEFGMIVEFSYDPDAKEWIPLRIRHDKTEELRMGAKQFGNDMRTAQSIWESIHAPITTEMITTGKMGNALSGNSYYLEGDRKRFPFKTFHGAIKKYLYTTFIQPNSDLLELACGRAGDKNRWWAAKVKSITGIDNNQEGIENNVDGACKRVLEDILKGQKADALFLVADAGKPLTDPESGLTDRSQEYLRLLNGIPIIRMTPRLQPFESMFKKGYDAISCQFAVHYFFENEISVSAFIENIKTLSKPGTVFFGTVLDGQTVYSELQDNESIKVYDSDQKQLISQITRRFDPTSTPWSTNTLGTQIEVYYESFNNSKKEYLVPFDYLTSKMKEIGFDLIESKMFRDMHLKEQELLPLEQQQMSYLHRTFVFKRPEETPAAEEPKSKPKARKTIRKKAEIEK